MRVIAIANQKGGCGKTTTAVNLGASLGVLDKRVLLVDFDPQSHATVALSEADAWGKSGVADVLSGRITVGEAARSAAPGLDLLGSAWELGELETELVGRSETHHLLKDALQSVAARYDLVVVDCPPNTGPLTKAALASTDLVIVPVETSYFALYGVGRMLRLIEEENSRRRRPLLYGVLLTLFDRRTNHARSVLKQLRDHFGSRLLNSVITFNVSLREAAAHGRPITEYRPRSRGFTNHMDLAKEVMALLAVDERRARTAASGGRRWKN